jgi:hypothetical protein
MRSWLSLVVAGALVAGVGAADAAITITHAGEWMVTVHAKATLCVDEVDQCKSASASDEQTLFLAPGTIVEVAVQAWECGAIPLGDYCALATGDRARRHEKRRRRVKYIKTVIGSCDKAGLNEILDSCSPYAAFQLRRITGFEKVAEDGNSFVLKAVFGFTATVQGYAVHGTVATIVKGVRVGDGLSIGDREAETPASTFTPPVAEVIERAVDATLHP